MTGAAGQVRVLREKTHAQGVAHAKELRDRSRHAPALTPTLSLSLSLSLGLSLNRAPPLTLILTPTLTLPRALTRHEIALKEAEAEARRAAVERDHWQERGESAEQEKQDYPQPA